MYRIFAVLCCLAFTYCGGSGGGQTSSVPVESSDTIMPLSESLDQFYLAQGSEKSHCMNIVYSKLKEDLSIFKAPAGLVPPCSFTGYDVRKVQGGQSHESSGVGQEFDGKILEALGASSTYREYDSVNPKAPGCPAGTIKRGPSLFTSSDCGTISIKGCYDCPRSPDLIQPDPTFAMLACESKTDHVVSSRIGANVSVSFYANETPPDSLSLQGGSFNVMIGDPTRDSEVYQGKNPGAGFSFSLTQSASGTLKIIKVNLKDQSESETGELIPFTWNPVTRTINIDLVSVLTHYRDEYISLLIASGGYDSEGHIINDLRVLCTK